MDIPQLTRISTSDNDGVYEVTFLNVDGAEIRLTITVSDFGGVPEPDIFMNEWRGDAESVRRVFAAVSAFHRARDTSRNPS